MFVNACTELEDVAFKDGWCIRAKGDHLEDNSSYKPKN